MRGMATHATALTIAGSDSGGGAGIQADLKTFAALHVFGTSVVTAITAQNLEKVTSIQTLPTKMVDRQLRAVLEGFPVRAAKTGMLFSAAIIRTLVHVLKDYPPLLLVVDPVFAASSGSPLIEQGAIRALQNWLFPLAALITPNIPEAELLLGRRLVSAVDQKKGAEELFRRFGVPVLLKGGHLRQSARDVLVDRQGLKAFSARQVRGVNSHGSGCTFSAAIAAGLARGFSLRPAVGLAKEFISQGLAHPLQLKPGLRVINHLWKIP